jgi:heme oxygenase
MSRGGSDGRTFAGRLLLHTLQKHGATDQELAFLRTQRVELNAMTSRQFVAHLEAKLAENAVSRVIPEEKVLEGHARYLLEVMIANQELEKILPEVRKRAAAQQLPADLRKLVAEEFEKTPAWAWDRVVVDLVKR